MRLIHKHAYFFLSFPEKKLLNKSYPIIVCPTLNASFVTLHPYDCPVTNHTIGVLNTIIL